MLAVCDIRNSLSDPSRMTDGDLEYLDDEYDYSLEKKILVRRPTPMLMIRHGRDPVNN